MNIDSKKIFCIMLLLVLLIAPNVAGIQLLETSSPDEKEQNTPPTIPNRIKLFHDENDLDPLINLKVTVTIKEIRAFDKIDMFSDPDFYVKVIINEKEFTSNIWHNQKTVKEEWKQTVDVTDYSEFVVITIQLWDSNNGLDKQCDIAKNDNSNPSRRDITVYYNLKTGHWIGDDAIGHPSFGFADYSGYGHANGCDDNSIYDKDRDCELWFDISQNDFDNDSIPYWTEMYVYNETGQCDPLFDDRGRDDDEDGIPIEWEHKWGHFFDWDYDHSNEEWILNHNWYYHPFKWDDHKNLDPDGDSIDNYEEYLTSEWYSDPFRKDIFVELDKMDEGPNGEPKSDLPIESRELLYKAFNRQNIIFHLDDGEMGGGEVIPFDTEGEKTNGSEIREIYQNYFLHGDNDTWRRGVFHYGLILYATTGAAGYAFHNNAFQISSKGMDNKSTMIGTRNRDVVYASAYMHELGHTLDLNWLGGHYQQGKFFYQIGWWIWRPYKSVMNYGYMYGFIYNLVDYSDGSRGRNDYDDWSNIDYSYFES